MREKYRTIYADPPWIHERGGGKIKRGANRHYPLMQTSEIIDLGGAMQDLIDTNAHLYLWSTNGSIPDALKVMGAWGFRYLTMITWVKQKFGLGHYFRGQTEHCLFGVKGTLPYKRNESTGKFLQGRTVILAPTVTHSSKPSEMRRMIELVSYPPRLELFARYPTKGWDVQGNDSFLKVQPFP